MKKILLLAGILVLSSVDFYASYKTIPTSAESFESLMNIDSPDFGRDLVPHDHPSRRKRMTLEDMCSRDLDKLNRDLVPLIRNMQKNNQDCELDRMNRELAPFIRDMQQNNNQTLVSQKKSWRDFMGCYSSSAVVPTCDN